MVSLRKDRRVFFFIFVIFLILLLIEPPIFGDFIFTPNNHQFALYNTQLRAVTVPLVFVRNRNIVGSTYFSDNTSSYIGFLTTQDQGSTYTISFSYFTWSNVTGWNNLKSLQKVLIFTDDIPQLMVDGLTCDYINGTNVFTTLQTDVIDDQNNFRLISFFLNGTIKTNHQIVGESDRYFNFRDITSLKNGSYCLIVGKYLEDPPSSITNRVILTVNSTGYIQREIVLNDEIFSLAFMSTKSPTDFLWTGSNIKNFFFQSSSLSERDESGTAIRLYPIEYPPTEMDFLAPDVLLIRRVRPTILTLDLYDVIPVITFLLIISFWTILGVRKRRSSTPYLSSKQPNN